MLGQVSEFEALIDSALKSEGFASASLKSAILRHLFVNRGDQTKISEKGIAEAVFGIKPGAPYSGQRIRTQCMAVRSGLESYASSPTGQVQKWRCTLPKATAETGYLLRFEDQTQPHRATEAFWLDHLESEFDTIVVHTEPLFFRDQLDGRVIRYFDANDDRATLDSFSSELARRFSETEAKMFRPSYLYLLSGEIAARDQIADWFEEAGHRRVKGAISRNLDTIENRCPVLLGNPFTNRFMRDQFAAQESEYLDFRFDLAQLNCIRVRLRTANEEFSANLVNDYRREDCLCVLTDKTDREVYGMVTRIPNPYGDGCITIIASHNTRAIEQIATTLTNENRLQKVFAQLGFSPQEKLPTSFEWLFAVPSSVGNQDSQAGLPRLVLSRSGRSVLTASPGDF